MLDIQFIRDNADQAKAAAKNKGINVDVDELLKLDEQRRKQITEIEAIRSERNEIAASMKGQKPSDEQIEKAKQLKDELQKLEEAFEPVDSRFKELLYLVPNIPSEDTPIGNSEDENITLRTWGDKPEFSFEPKAHWDMDQFFDEERAVRISGKRFTFLKGGLVQLQFALVQFGFDVLTDESILKEIADGAGLDVSTKPFVPMLPPTMMRAKSYKATGRLKPEEVTFKLANDDLWLTGSSEHTMCAYHLGETLDEEDLPLRYVGYNTAYRREVGSDGKDTRGIIRQHQFDKLEMETFTTSDTSRVEHEFMIAIQEYLMQKLELPYQLVHKCTFDMGGPNIRGVDIETWMAGQGVYRETHTADYIGDYQARGLGTKVKRKDGTKELAHMNDATAFSQRPLIAILENNQNEDGSITIPDALQKYMGKDKI